MTDIETAVRERAGIGVRFREGLALAALAHYFEPPVKAWDDPEDGVWIVRTRPGFIFDDYFWDVFHALDLHVCHVAYYGPERRVADGAPEGVFELRFKAGDRWTADV